MPLDLSPDELLTTTRSVRRRLDLDRPVEIEVVNECLRVALQAPNGSNRQGWHWVVVTDPDLRGAIADYYRRAAEPYLEASKAERERYSGDRRLAQDRVAASADHLRDNLHRVPVLVIGCLEGEVDKVPPGHQAGFWGSLLPAAWSFMLAARARGLGTAWTSLHLSYASEVGELLGIPPTVSQGVLIPVAYSVGTHFSVAPREPLEKVVHYNTW